MLFLTVLILASSPLFWMIIRLNIISVFVMIFLGIIFQLFYKTKYNLAILLGVLIIFLFNNISNNHRFLLKENLNLRVTAQEVNTRFDEENYLVNFVNIPLILRRIGYNRYFFLLKNFVTESFKLFDFDRLFFQEKSPHFTDGVIIFRWFLIWLLLIGLLYGRYNKFLIFYWMIMSLTWFWTSTFDSNIKYFGVMVLISILISSGILKILSYFHEK